MRPSHPQGVAGKSVASHVQPSPLLHARRMHRWRRGALCALFVFFISPPGFAQNAGRVSGLVRDPSGAVIPGASVLLRDEATGTELRSVTDPSGYYVLEPVPPKTYTLAVQMRGFKTYSRPGLVIQPAARVDIPVTLEIGQQTEMVEVTAAANVVLTDSGAKVDAIGAAQMRNLSTVGRNAMELLTLLPGVVNTGFDPLNGSSFGQGVNQFHINGMREDQNDIRMDNAHMIDPGNNGGFIIEPNMDMIQEFSVKTSNFEADQGRSPLIIDTVSKSGASSLHGELYYYARNATFNANDFSNNLANLPKPSSKFNYPGFNIGGPVRLPHSGFNKNKDKMFFFFGAEWQRQLPDPGTQLATVPTARMRAGDFSELLNPQFCKTGSGGKVTGGRYLNMPCIVKDPGTWGTPLSGNILPANEVTDNGRIFLNLFPLPNFVDSGGQYNFAGRPLLPLNRNEQHGKVDYVISDKTRMYVRVARNFDHTFYPFGLWSGENSGWTSNIPEPSPTLGTNSGEALTVNLVKVINPTLTNEFQFNTQALRLPNRYADPSKLSKQALGFKFKGMTFNGFNNNVDTAPQITDAWDYFGGNPGAGRWGAGNMASGVFADKTEFEWLDNVSKVHGAHTLKFGVSVDRTRNDQNGGPAVEGRFITDTWGMSSGNEFADILTEHFVNFGQTSKDNDGLWRFWNVEWYAQDSWKATRRLTLNYGARFSWMQPWNEARGLALTWDPQAYDPSQPKNFLNGLLFASKGQVSNSVYPNPRPIFQPRIGFAWDISGTGKSVLRGGVGTYVQRDQGNIAFNMANAPPNSFNSSPSAPGGKGFLSLSDIEKADPFGSLGAIDIQAANRFDASQPQVYEWSLTWSQNIGVKTVLETSYVGNVSRHLFNRHNVNVIPPGAMWQPGTTDFKLGPDGKPDTNRQDYVPYKPWGSIFWSDHSQTANYNSLQAIARRNVSNGLTLLASYTWSKTLGYANNFQGGTDPFDTRRNYGLLPWDRAHNLSFSYIYQLPSPAAKHFGSSRVAKGVLDGWQLSGITHYSSGRPEKIGRGSLNCVLMRADGTSDPMGCRSLGTFTGNGATWYGSLDEPLTPVILSNPQSGRNFAGVGNLWLNQSSVTLPPLGQFGTFEQPTFRAPGSNNWDITLFKSFPFGEKRRIEFRWAVFDMFNRSQFDRPQTSAQFNWVVPAGATSVTQGAPVLANSDSFGRITNKHGHREMEFALKVYF